ncbi:MAG TPA: VCBS repeat-containing protein [Longimicrobiales bacterium]|nr:VCBS repeat-containing protein [Longimicrobiales bacterium]
MSLVLLGAGCASPPDSAGGTRALDRQLVLEDSAYTSANVSVGDVDGDGHEDIVLVKGRHWPLVDLVLRGLGDGTFEAAYAVGASPDRSYSGELVDLDRDGDLDLVVSNDAPDPKLVHLNDGSGRFTVASTFGDPEWPTRHLAVADLNGDSLPDVVLANRYGPDGGPGRICFGVGEGRFAPECDALPDGSATTIRPADLDGDGDLDLVVPHRDGGQSFIHLNDGNGEFDERVPFGAGDDVIRSVRTADINVDGVLDLVVIDERSGPSVLFGAPDLTFDPPLALGEVAARPYALAVHDLDENGRPDVIIGYVEARPVVYFNDEGAGFAAVPFGDDAGAAYGFAVGDLDEDGLLDVVMARSDAPNMLYFGMPPSSDAP